MIQKTYILIIFTILSVGCTKREKKLSSYHNDKTVLIIVDNKSINIKENNDIREKINNQELDFITGSTSPREAILRYGEKARKGILVFKTPIDSPKTETK